MEKTLESVFIKQYEEMEKRLEKANSKIAELESKKEVNKEETLEKPVVIKTFSKECCYLSVSSDYNIIKTSHFKDLTSQQVKEIILNYDKLKEYAEKLDDHWEYSRSDKFVKMTTKAFPYTALIQDHIVMIDCDNYNSFDANCYVMRNKNNFETGRYFDIKEKDRLYEYGLELFKEELQKVYKKKLKEEQETTK